MTGRPFQDLHPDRGVGPSVPNKLNLTKSELTLLITTDSVIHPNWMAFRMESDRFIAGQAYFYRLLQVIGRQRGMTLDA